MNYLVTYDITAIKKNKIAGDVRNHTDERTNYLVTYDITVIKNKKLVMYEQH